MYVLFFFLFHLFSSFFSACSTILLPSLFLGAWFRFLSISSRVGPSCDHSRISGRSLKCATINQLNLSQFRDKSVRSINGSPDDAPSTYSTLSIVNWIITPAPRRLFFFRPRPPAFNDGKHVLLKKTVSSGTQIHSIPP